MGRSPTNTKEKILQSANDLIWQSSYGAVSVDDICATAGVKKGSFYYYFSSKAELAITVMEESFINHESAMKSLFSPDTPPLVSFESLVTFIYDKQKEAFNKYGHVCGCPIASLGSEMAGNEEIIQKKAEEICSRQGAFLKAPIQKMMALKLLPQDTDIDALSSQITTVILGQLMLARIQNNLTNLKQNLRTSLFQTLNIDHEKD
ncbi:MAG: TetR/AcrR family transcriptional regulator [Piscirickettsiaceae bacterium]|nr:TetR/AcrR family transcriptional regulator [Piscirickettsiaceae bacterium]